MTVVGLAPKAEAKAGRTSLAGKRAGLVAAALLALLAAGLLWRHLHAPPTPHYLSAPATRGDIARAAAATGTVNPELTIIVGSYVSGVLVQISCDYNTQVKAGQICARIDPRPYQALVDQAKANLAVAKAQLVKDQAGLAYTKLNWERNRLLLQQKSVARDAADLSKSNLDQAEAQIGFDLATIDQRQALLAAAQVDLDYTNITSPVNGTVVSRNVTQGQTLASSLNTPTLFLIATDLTRMQVDTNVSESDIGEVKQGDKASFTVDAFPTRLFSGTVTQVRQSPQTVQNVVTYDAVVSVANTDLALKPGMTASTRIITDQRTNVLRAPNQALRFTPANVDAAAPLKPGLARLWLLRDEKPVAIDIVAGLDDDNFTEIVQGDVKAGDVILLGAEGSAVR
ncbi:efflux transporter periplasmic adaptor subunit [Rhodoblastus sphagnicola]|uniref:Efflux transporter periplasmic adaptor subunit n=1 Tax=Rhodoblastus sphagnicola TaxID=333368 RepID=A0A2S6N1U3_9HYPH|nr:efflux RND transporter periplasmic adaptor subunit [Rhodoblastus sphagnicola]MBB4198236.1 HlyD family secretion protein [Rhodoblastus sphagnicola]PPQ28593.1 efflux transporter periplasmic adaptor subunit [Rhodoblastus sphagnicola]